MPFFQVLLFIYIKKRRRIVQFRLNLQLISFARNDWAEQMVGNVEQIVVIWWGAIEIGSLLHLFFKRIKCILNAYFHFHFHGYRPYNFQLMMLYSKILLHLIVRTTNKSSTKRETRKNTQHNCKSLAKCNVLVLR